MEPEIHPIDMLVDLVISDEIDPWEIDIADIANRFLEKIREMSKINLRLSGKTLLTASILLRMKSESLIPQEEEEWEEGEELDWGWNGEEEKESVRPISMPMRRRSERKTTLFELIGALQRALSEEMIRKNFPREGRHKPKLIIQIDEEGIKEKIAKTYRQVQNLAKLHEVIKFSDLISGKTKERIIGVLLSLLYLDSQRKIRIWQKKLFGEIFITLR